MTDGRPHSDDEALEDAARRRYRLDAVMGGVGFFDSWESVPESTKNLYRELVRRAREDRGS